MNKVCIFAACVGILGVMGCSKSESASTQTGSAARATVAPVVTAARVPATAAAKNANDSADAPSGAQPGSGATPNDGLPEDLPSGTSKVPSVNEWENVAKEVTVKNSTERGCQTRMLREWLRVSCRPKGALQATSVATVESDGQQAFAGMFGDRASIVVQVVRNKRYTARLTWNDNRTGTLVVDWPNGAPRPTPFSIDFASTDAPTGDSGSARASGSGSACSDYIQCVCDLSRAMESATDKSAIKAADCDQAKQAYSALGAMPGGNDSCRTVLDSYKTSMRQSAPLYAMQGIIVPSSCK